MAWDARRWAPWAEEIDGADAVDQPGRTQRQLPLHPGEPAGHHGLARGLHPRVGEAIAGAERPPRVWLQTSTATIYAHRYDAPNDEATGILGGEEPNAPDTWRFSIEVARAWERAVDEAKTPHTRKVTLRSAMAMSPDRGGIFDMLLGWCVTAWADASATGGSTSRGFMSGLRARDLLAHRARASRAGQLRRSEPAAQRRFHARAARGVGDPVRLGPGEWMLEIGAALSAPKRSWS